MDQAGRSRSDTIETPRRTARFRAEKSEYNENFPVLLDKDHRNCNPLAMLGVNNVHSPVNGCTLGITMTRRGARGSALLFHNLPEFP